MAVVLVTGGAGYVGSHACKALAAAGHVPVAYDNLATGWRDAVRYGPFVEGDILDSEGLDRAFSDHRPDAIMHFAALSCVPESAQKPAEYWRNNVTGSMELLAAARRHEVQALVFSSTCATYGETPDGQLDETKPQHPVNVYGRTKLAVEHLLGDFNGAYGIESVTFRYFNAAGADPSGEIGEDHRPETHLIPLILDAASGKRESITVYGSDYPTPDGTCIRDYVHVTDLADAHVRGVEWLLAGRGSLQLNLGSGSGHSVRAVVEAARGVTGLDIPVVEGERRFGDPPCLVSSSTKAQEILGWTCRRAALDTMVADAWDWHQRGGYAS